MEEWGRQRKRLSLATIPASFSWGSRLLVFRTYLQETNLLNFAALLQSTTTIIQILSANAVFPLVNDRCCFKQSLPFWTTVYCCFQWRRQSLDRRNTTIWTRTLSFTLIHTKINSNRGNQTEKRKQKAKALFTRYKLKPRLVSVV